MMQDTIPKLVCGQSILNCQPGLNNILNICKDFAADNKKNIVKKIILIQTFHFNKSI